jgi:hypothetical protein
MIHGAHAIIYSTNAEADRAFFRDVLKYRFADAGHGWLIFALPPAEVAVHPSESGGTHELYLMCDDVNALVADMKKRGIATSDLHEERWGILTQVTLPSGGKLGIYEPRHASPLAKKASGGGRAAKKKAAPAAKAKRAKSAAKAKPAKKSAKKSAKRR